MEIELQILKNQATIMMALTDLNNDLETVKSLDERMRETLPYFVDELDNKIMNQVKKSVALEPKGDSQ